MSERAELREALAAELARLIGRTSLQTWADIADALLAGPVGKLQAENERLREGIIRLLVQCDEQLERLADPERIRREAIGAWVRRQPRRWLAKRYEDVGWNDCLDRAEAAGESAVTGEEP